MQKPPIAESSEAALYDIDVIHRSGYLAHECVQGLSVRSLQECTIVPAGQYPGPFPDDRIRRELAAGNKPGHPGKEVIRGTESSSAGWMRRFEPLKPKRQDVAELVGQIRDQLLELLVG